MTQKEFIKMLNAVGDRTRLKILKIIARSGEISCLKITKRVQMSQPTISHHLKLLVDAKLVNLRRSGKYGFFSINKNTIKGLTQEITKLIKNKSRR